MKHIITLLPALLCGCNDNVVGDKNITVIDMEDKQETIETNIDYVAYNSDFVSIVRICKLLDINGIQIV